MSLKNYTDLTAGMGNWLQRQDIATLFPDFVTLFEAWVNRKLAVRQQETTVELTTSNGVVTLPADYLNWKRMTWTGNPKRELDWVEGSWLQAMYPDNPQDIPEVFTIEGGNIITMPIDTTGTSLEFVYCQKVPSLQVSSTNWLMTEHPDLYLFGSLTEASAFATDVKAAVLWKARRDELFDEIKDLSNQTRGPGAIRVMGPTP